MKKKTTTTARSKATGRGEIIRAEMETRSPKGITAKSKVIGVAEDLPLHPSRVRVDGGLTKNLGDFESARLSVSIETPCGNSSSDIRKAYHRTRKLVEKCLEEEYQQVIGDD